MIPLTWSFNPFGGLSPSRLYAIIKLRNEVFVVEQNCVYQDADGKDPLSWHLTGWDGDILVAYTRVIPPGISYKEASIGRVVISPRYRGTGTGRKLMEESISRAFNQFNCTEIRIGAQAYLTRFYQSLGFRQISDEYLEDNIPHIGMILSK